MIVIEPPPLVSNVKSPLSVGVVLTQEAGLTDSGWLVKVIRSLFVTYVNVTFVPEKWQTKDPGNTAVKVKLALPSSVSLLRL